MKIYLASSWRNKYYAEVLEYLCRESFEVYDFRRGGFTSSLNTTETAENNDLSSGFHWQNVSERWLEWTPAEYIQHLSHPMAEEQFERDIQAMEACDACVLILPCGRSAHTEAGWFAGKGKKVVAYIPEKQEPELMYRLFSSVCSQLNEISIKLNGK